jgi:Thiol:disulfide interchange protein DsbD, N-terminal
LILRLRIHKKQLPRTILLFIRQSRTHQQTDSERHHENQTKTSKDQSDDHNPPPSVISVYTEINVNSVISQEWSAGFSRHNGAWALAHAFDSAGQSPTIEPMQKKLFLLLSLIFFLGAGPKGPVIVTVGPLNTLEVRPGSHADLQVDFQILKGFHIQANPASEPYLIATTLKVEALDGMKVSDPVYPKGVSFQLEGSEKAIFTYEGEISIKVPLEIDKDAKAGEQTLKGSLRYQGCDARTCYPPTTIPVEGKIKVAD